MTDKIIVLVTAGNAREARKIAKSLVESHLAACVNIVPGMRSLYCWNGKTVDDHEVLLLIKTTRKLFGQVSSKVLANHSYSTPEVVALPIIDGSPNYLRWIDDAVGNGEQKLCPDRPGFQKR